MNKKETKSQEELNRSLYRIPSGASYQLRSKNAVYLASNNTVRHELAKTLGAYMLIRFGDIKFNDEIKSLLRLIEIEVEALMQGFIEEKSSFITEAVPKKEESRRVDLVRLKDGTRFEFETNKKITKLNAITIRI